jgi:hypothetical protein
MMTHGRREMGPNAADSALNEQARFHWRANEHFLRLLKRLVT